MAGTVTSKNNNSENNTENMMIELHGFSLDDMVDLASYCRKSDACNLIASAFVKIFKVRPDKTVEITPINKYEKCFKAFPGLSKYGVKLNVQGVERALRSLLQKNLKKTRLYFW